MRYGYSTGALTKGDFRAALRMLEAHDVTGVEISALRMHELDEMIEALPTLDLKKYEGHVSLHAPSKFSAAEEAPLAERIAGIADLVEGIVVHSEAIIDPSIWRPLGDKVFVENADGRKRTGRTTAEMEAILADLPDARVCLDLAHVYQVDPSLVEARRMLRAIGDRVGQIHLSQLDHSCGHQPLMYGVVHEFQGLCALVPETTVILESCVDEDEIGFQLELARQCFTPLEPSGA